MATPTPAAKTKTAGGPPKSFTQTMVDLKGNVLRFIANATKNGWTTFVQHGTKNDAGKLEFRRGVTDRHEDRASADKALAAFVSAAEKKGWKKSAGGPGIAAKPDAFTLDALPSAKK